MSPIAPPDRPKGAPQPLAIFLHSGDYDRLHQGLSIAATACGLGRKVDIFFFWYALRALVEGRLDRPHFPADPEVEERFEELAIPTAQALLDSARQTGNCSLFACTASAAIVGADRPRLGELVDHQVGWATILQRTQGVVDRFYL